MQDGSIEMRSQKNPNHAFGNSNPQVSLSITCQLAKTGLGNAQTILESEMALFHERMLQCAQNVLETCRHC
jgi:hypothetical protein